MLGAFAGAGKTSNCVRVVELNCRFGELGLCFATTKPARVAIEYDLVP